MLRLQRELNIPSHSVELKMSVVLKNLIDTVFKNTDRNEVIRFNWGIRD